MLSGKGNEKGERTTMGLISKKATLHVQRTLLYIFLPLICTTTIWNFQKLPSYTFYGGNVVRVLAVPDTDLEIREWGQSSRPLEKGEGGVGWVRSPKISKNFFRPFGPQFGLKIRANPGPPGPFPGSVTFLLFFFFTVAHWYPWWRRAYLIFSPPLQNFHVVLPTEKRLFCFSSLAYFLFISVFFFSYIPNSWTWQSIDNTDTETISAFRFRPYLPFSCLCFTRRKWLCDFPLK